MTSTNQDRDVESRLRHRELRYTKGRRLVVRALADFEGPQSAAELHARIGPAVPLSSLYRSFAVLEEAGVVTPHLGARGLIRYELAEWLKGHHHHLICVDCGAVEDVSLPQPAEARVRELVAGIGSRVSFTPFNHALEIEGRCSRCA